MGLYFLMKAPMSIQNLHQIKAYAFLLFISLCQFTFQTQPRTLRGSLRKTFLLTKWQWYGSLLLHKYCILNCMYFTLSYTVNLWNRCNRQNNLGSIQKYTDGKLKLLLQNPELKNITRWLFETQQYMQGKITTKINSVFSYSTYNIQKRNIISVEFNDMKYWNFIKINLLWSNQSKYMLTWDEKKMFEDVLQSES